jgi:hypothetical protein
MVLVLTLVAGACTFALVASLTVNWASGKSPLWNIGFAVVIVLASAGVLVLAVVLLMRIFSR